MIPQMLLGPFLNTLFYVTIVKYFLFIYFLKLPNVNEFLEIILSISSLV